MHRPLFLVTAGSVAAVGGLLFASAMPAGAATAALDAQATTCTVTGGSANGVACTDPADTPVTFSITTTGVLAITAPDATVDVPINLGNVQLTGSATTLGGAANFGDVTVSDNRALNPADWTAVVSSTDFVTTNTVGPTDTILASAATYTIPAANSLTGGIATAGRLAAPTGLPLPGTTDLTDNAAGGLPLANAVAGPPIGTPVLTETGYDGDNGATWNPGIVITVPANAVAGTYAGTVTHSVT